MENPGYIALSRQMVLRRQMDVMANNVANIATPAFKAEGMMFVEHLRKTEPGEKIRFVQDIATVRDLRPGALTHTGGPLDLAIQGEGYFAVETPEGPRYTRAGGFTLDADGQIVTARGYPLLDDGGAPLALPTDAGEITVSRDGTIVTDQGEVGRVGVVGFADEQALKHLEGGLYDSDGQEPVPVETPEVEQGALEGSNVAGVVEMTKLIATVRLYQSAAKMADEEHQRQRRAIDALASVRS